MDEIFVPSRLDADMLASLKKHENVIRGIQSKAIYELGEELQAAHDDLAKKGYGCFYAWCESIGFKSSTTKNILHYHSLIGENLTNQDFIESLPKSLIYAAAKPSTPKPLKNAVISGDVKSLKEYKDLEAKYKASQQLLSDRENDIGKMLPELKQAKDVADNAQQMLASREQEFTQTAGEAEHLKVRAERAERLRKSEREMKKAFNQKIAEAIPKLSKRAKRKA